MAKPKKEKKSNEYSRETVFFNYVEKSPEELIMPNKEEFEKIKNYAAPQQSLDENGRMDPIL